MLKKILIALVVLIIAIVAGLYVFSGKLDGIIKETIETEGTAALGAAVKVGRVVTDLQKGRAEISGLTISNPAGYQAQYAIELSNFNAEVDYADQTVKEIIINQPVINAEQKGKRNNFQDLLDRMPASDEVEEQTNASSGPEITIKKIALQKATINLLTSELEVAGQALDFGNRSFVMSDYVASNVTGTAEEISDYITRELIGHVSAQIKVYMTKELTMLAKAKATEKIKEEAKKLIEDKLGESLGDNIDVELNEKSISEKIDKKAIGDKLKNKFKLN